MYRLISVIFLALGLQSANASTLSNSDIFEISFSFKMTITTAGDYDFVTGDLIRQHDDFGQSYFGGFQFSNDPKNYSEIYLFSFDNDYFRLQIRYDVIEYDFQNNVGKIFFDANAYSFVNRYYFDPDGTGTYWEEDDSDPTFSRREAELSQIFIRVTDTSTGEIVRSVDLSQVPLPASLPLLVFSVALAFLRYGRPTNRGH